MAGYEYVSSEQLAGFDKYKVARALRMPLFLLVLVAEELARSVSPCAAWFRAGWRAFLRGSCQVLGLWSRGAWEHPSLAFPTGTLPGIALSFGDRSTRVERENSLRFFTSSLSLCFSLLRGDIQFLYVVCCLRFNEVSTRFSCIQPQRWR